MAPPILIHYDVLKQKAIPLVISNLKFNYHLT
jgi:hypothetical protein